MDDARFWTMIEDAWAGAPAQARAERDALAARDPGADAEVSEELSGALDGVVARLRGNLDRLERAELAAFDHALERALHAIDRAEIQAVTDGSDDGFLYCRGFIVAMGQRFYDAVNADPEMAILDAELEEMCYLSWHLHQEKFAEDVPSTGISRESCSNAAGWPDVAD